MRTIVFALEEPSAKEMLKGILPKLLPSDMAPRFMVFKGKSDLEKRLPVYLRNWRIPYIKFVVIRDQDSADCQEVKTKLLELCRNAGKQETLVRVACHELESFYLGDLSAVENGLGLKGLARKQNSRKFRNPDRDPWGRTKLTI